MQFKKCSTVLAAFVVGGTILTTGVARADSIGQCNNRPGNYVSSASEWQHVLGNEGVTSQAQSQIFAPAGFVSGDQTIGQWMTQRVIIAKAAKPFSGHDYGCRDGNMFSAGHRGYARGKAIFFVLPSKYRKGDFSLHKTQKHNHAILIRGRAIGLPDCGNTFQAFVWILIYVEKPAHHKPAKKHHKKPKPVQPAPQPPTQNCSGNNNGSGSTGSVTGNCSSQGDCNGVANCNVVIVPPTPCICAPAFPSIKISSHIDLNQISAGKTSGPLSFTVTASDAGGSVTVDPGNGGVSDCNGGPVRSDITFDHLAAGNNPECIIVTAPDDADKPATGSVAYSATLTTSGGTSTDSVVDGYNIKYPIQT
jgi:hypothetical protein